jgi:predicted site-specific integrase-resolvase
VRKAGRDTGAAVSSNGTRLTDDGLLGVRKTAAILNVHENTLRNMIKDGRIEVARRLPSSRFPRFHPDEVERVRQEIEREGGLGRQRAAHLALRAALPRLVDGWDNLAGEIETDALAGEWVGQDARTLRYCAAQLRGLIRDARP